MKTLTVTAKELLKGDSIIKEGLLPLYLHRVDVGSHLVSVTGEVDDDRLGYQHVDFDPEESLTIERADEDE